MFNPITGLRLTPPDMTITLPKATTIHIRVGTELEEPGKMGEEKIKDKQLHTVSQYATYHKVDRKQVYRWIEAGKIIRYRGVGGEPLLDLEDYPQELEV